VRHMPPPTPIDPREAARRQQLARWRGNWAALQAADSHPSSDVTWQREAHDRQGA